MPPGFSKGVQSCHPDVTMRLETPVIYFHPPASQKTTETANVTVKFRGGWLTEYYPYADASAPGLSMAGSESGPAGLFRFAHLCSGTEGKLEWNKLEIGGKWPLTNTTAHVWTSPRAVQAASVQTINAESEKFLFYRGVGHLDVATQRSAVGRVGSDIKAPSRVIAFHANRVDVYRVARDPNIEFALFGSVGGQVGDENDVVAVFKLLVIAQFSFWVQGGAEAWHKFADARAE